MAGRKPHTGPVKLVISFDIGTIYSSISYCIPELHQVPKVRTVARYPGQGAACADTKLPSLLYYDQSGTVRAAGAEALARDVIKTALTEGWQKAEWWKLHLRPGHLNSDPVEDLPPLPLGKAAVDILTDFIKYLFDCCKTYIQGRHPKFSWSSVQDSIEYILTYPGGWDEQQYVYRHAVQQAGLVPSTASGQNRVYMLTEGEASLHSCFSNLLKRETAGQAAPEGVVVIDAGGGTIGMSTFSLRVTSKPISCTEAAPARCRLQGSLFVSCRAKALIQRKLQGWEHSNAEDIDRFTGEFDQTTKLVIDSDRVPAYVRVGDRRTESSRHCISSGQLELSGSEVTGLFNDSVDAIINSFEQQGEFSIPITRVFFVGGLARNDWVWLRLQLYFTARNIVLYRWKYRRNEEVANGAVMNLVDHDNRLVAPRTMYHAYHVVGQQLLRAKAERVVLEETVYSLRAREECFNSNIVQLKTVNNSLRAQEEHFNSKIVRLETENDSLRALLGAHEQKHQSETLYASGRIKDAAESLVKLLGTTTKPVRTNGLFARWILEYSHRCLLKLVTMGDGALDYEDAIEAYSTALSLIPHPTSVRVLNKWATTILMHHSAHEALGAATNFKLPKFVICRAICDILEQNDRVKEAIIFYRQIDSELAGDTHCSDERARWESDFLRCCVKKLEKVGDDAMHSQNYHMAAEYFSTMLSLNILDSIHILVKRSEALASMNLWVDALRDADEAIKLDPSDYRGYERRYTALHGAERYVEAVEAFLTMRSKPGVDLTKYVDARPKIRCIIEKTLCHMPKVLIDTTTGRLCDRQQQIEAFLADPIYSELVSSMTTGINRDRIRAPVKEFYRYVMLSHKWEPPEPDHQQVKSISVYDLPTTSSNGKLQGFCSLARTLGFRWAWTDSSCVDRESNVVLQESLVAMFTWYRGSSLTIVYLRGVSSESQLPGDLSRSIWNTRAWTYQEYVAPPVIQFYTEDWKPYLGLELLNHKEAPAIIAEMQQATGVSAEEMAILRPGRDRVRKKLYLASRREATLVEDIAYSLFGIFDVALPVIYGERTNAVGRLLEGILTGSGDVTVLAWTGNAGGYNSCLPNDLTVYNPLVPPHIPRPIEQAEMHRIITTLRSSLDDLSLAKALRLHHNLNELQPPIIAANRMWLPGIMSSLTNLRVAPDTESAPIFVHADALSAAPTPSRVVHVSYPITPVKNRRVYRAATQIFGAVEIQTSDDLTGKNLCLVHPWVRPLLDQEFAERADELDETTQALRIVARLRQPFGALMFEKLARTEYRRIAADCLLKVKVQDSEEVTLDKLIGGVRTIEVL